MNGEPSSCSSDCMAVDATASETVNERKPEFVAIGIGNERLNIGDQIGTQDIVLGNAVLLDNWRRFSPVPSCNESPSCFSLRTHFYYPAVASGI